MLGFKSKFSVKYKFRLFLPCLVLHWVRKASKQYGVVVMARLISNAAPQCLATTYVSVMYIAGVAVYIFLSELSKGIKTGSFFIRGK